MKVRHPRVQRAASALALVSALSASALLAPVAGAAPSPAPAGWKSVTFLGEQVEVPSSWPVFHLGAGSATCVRFDRHAVYLGVAGAGARCVGTSVGVASAIQIEPLADPGALELADALSPTAVNGQAALVGGRTSVTHRVVAAFPSSHVEMVVSYRTDASLARRIVASARFVGPAAAPSPAAAQPAGSATGSASSTSAAPAAGTRKVNTASVVYQGKGFDTCDAPTGSQMSAWKKYSPYGAVGVYIGGVNAACTNITSTWVSNETTAGWKLFPLYVGLQAPCAYQSGLASMSSNATTAASQGNAEAKDAVADDTGFGIGPGTTIYFDMENWNTGSTGCNAAVLAFISGWTKELHALGFDSGVYASLLSGMQSPGVESLWGSAGAPDAIDFAYWDGVATTSTPDLPSADWPSGHRIKQYNGNLTQTYGGVTLSLDQDYLDAPAVADAVAVPGGPTVAGVSPASGPAGNRVTVTGTNFVAGATSVTFGGVPAGSVRVLSTTELTAAAPAQPGASDSPVEIQVTTQNGQSATSTASLFTYVPFVGVAGDSTTGGYWFPSAGANVENFQAPFLGSAAASHPASRVVGMARTASGYVLASAAGNVFNFGTPWEGSPFKDHPASPVVGIAAVGNGYLLATAAGNVYNYGTRWYGSLAKTTLASPVVGIAATPTGGGYLLVTADGAVYAFHTASHGSLSAAPASPVVGIATTASGYLVATARGNVYDFGTPWHGSAAGTTLSSPVVGIASVGSGYVLATAAGQAYTYNTPFRGSPATSG